MVCGKSGVVCNASVIRQMIRGYAWKWMIVAISKTPADLLFGGAIQEPTREK